MSKHLADAGLPKTAAAILAAPPSVLAEFLDAANLDTAFTDSLTVPSTHGGPPPAAHLLKLLDAERAEHAAGPDNTGIGDGSNTAPTGAAPAETPLTPEEAAMAAANERHAAATAAVEAAETPEEKSAAKQLMLEARDERAAARFELALARAKRASTKDAKYAALTDRKADAISRAIQRRAAAQIRQMFDDLGDVSLSPVERDTGVYGPGRFTVVVGGSETEVEGRLLDGGTAIWRRGSGDFVVLQRDTDGKYHPVGAGSSKESAKAAADRIPILTVPSLPDGAGPLAVQAHGLLEGAAREYAADAANGKHVSWSAENRRSALNTKLSVARAKMVDGAAGAFEAERYEATGRHRRRAAEKAAAEAGRKARVEALAAGATPAEANAAAKRARRKALGTETRGGGVIPHFERKIPPPSLGKERYDAGVRSGVRSFGKETVDDYPIIASRAGNLAAWGFDKDPGMDTPQMSNINTLTARSKTFMSTLTSDETQALRDYTGSNYWAINAALTGREKNPTALTESTVTRLKSAFDKLNKHKASETAAMTVIRGTRVPSAWPDDRDSYLQHAFPVGAAIEVGKVTSCTTKPHVANSFAGSPGQRYRMVIRTRDGLSVKSVSQHSSEDEVIIPPGTMLRCVSVDKTGDSPIVYLVAEDLVAEADYGVEAGQKAA